MSDRGKGGEEVEKGSAQRHCVGLRDNQGSSKSAIRRLTRGGGVMRVSDGCIEETHNFPAAFLASIIRDAVTFAERAGRKTIVSMDVVHALKRQR